MGQHIAIVSALHAELAEVLALMPDEHKRTVGGRTFWSGHLHGHEVVATLSGMGKVAAATTTSLLIDHFKAEQVIFTGVAGGLALGVEVGDVVVGSGFVQHDMDVSPLFPRFELPGQGITRLQADGVLTQVLKEAAEDAVTWLPNLLDAATLASLGLHRPSVHQGLIVSGDRFVSSNTECEALRARLAASHLERARAALGSARYQAFDPRLAALRGGLQALSLPDDDRRVERVLGYPKIVPRLAFYQLSAGDVLAHFDARARLLPVPAKAPVTCSDADDQMFIDLAVAQRSTLLSKDKAVTSMQKRLLALGVRVQKTL